MKSNYFRFQVDELIKTYKQKIREQKFKDDQDMDTANKALYETVLFEINGAERYVDEKKRTYPKEFFLNLDVLLSNLIKEHNAVNGFLVCSSDSPTASVYVNHFEQGAMTDLSKALKKRYTGKRKLFGKTTAATAETDVDLAAAAKATAIGRSAMVLIIDGKLHLGKFDDVVYAEFDYKPDHSFTVALFCEEDLPLTKPEK